MHTPNLYLTVDGSGFTTLWQHEPHYFRDAAWWYHPGSGSSIMDNGEGLGYPPLKKYAISLGIMPGPEGIMAVTMDIKPATETPRNKEGRK